MTEPVDSTIDHPGRDASQESESALPEDSAAAVASILDRYLADLQAGEAPGRDELLAAHPELVEQLEACLAGIEFVHRAAGPAAEEPVALGEFRIVRELGRGGMGVVYEAEQTSLRRRVALKVLRYGAVADEEAMQRFRREAETVARLHHTNIVPIFAVGCERGVHYYAMQFIEGRSLAEVLEESQRAKKPLAIEDVARWGLEAAEALAHAHQRGVIHRDIKPSNLLIDREGVVWLTDFGLAKRTDEATLTVAGTLMGTPRYMSPEQAESLERPVDHRTDLYSLGASLYELATGQPVFQSSTPHGVIAQILNSEPARPRQIRPDLPRDLETIILTCMSKDPAGRYPSARALANDLRAVLDARPIQARRLPLPERVVRYIRKRKKVIGSGAIGIAAAVLLMLVAALGWRTYSDWRLGRVELTTGGHPLTAQVLDESGEQPVGEPFDFGARTVLSLPAGDYRLRLTGTGRLGRTYRMGVARGETHAHRVSLDEGLLIDGGSFPFSPATDALTLTPGKTDFIQWDGQVLMRRYGIAGESAWDASEPGGVGKLDRGRSAALAWMRRLALCRDGEHPGTLVKPAPDLDGDGTGDVVMAFARTPSLLAVSGRDGSMLWTYSAALDGPGGPEPLGPDEFQKVFDKAPASGDRPRLDVRGGRVIGSPVSVQIDGDGIPDLVALFFIFQDSSGSAFSFGIDGQVMHFENHQPGRRAIAAISGRTGRSLWSRNLDATTKSRPWLWDGINRTQWYQTIPHFDDFDSGIAVAPGRDGPILAQFAGSVWTALDPSTGRPRGRSIDFGFAPLRPVQYADLDGDGSSEVLALGPGPTPNAGSLILAAFSAATGENLWREPVGDPKLRLGALPLELPMVSDLEGDGRPEVLVPESGAFPVYEEYRGFRVLDGATGQTRWICPMRPYNKSPDDDGLVHLLEAPDLDGDGIRDVATVSTYLGRTPHSGYGGPSIDPPRVYVDVRSGKDGHPLWEWHADVTPGAIPWVGTPCWWGRGPDGWPMLAIPIGGRAPADDLGSATDDATPPSVHVLASTAGREIHTIDGLSWPRASDLDGDGLDDLWGSVQGRLRAFHAEASDAWRVLGPYKPAGDLDGDGVNDVVTRALHVPSQSARVQTGSRTVVARSGRDGRALWENRLDPAEDWLRSYHGADYVISTAARPDDDFDGDGTPDLLVLKTQHHGRFGGLSSSPPIRILSGRSGRMLWSSGLRLPGYEGHGYTDVWAHGVLPGERPGTLDILVLHGGRVGPSRQINGLARVSGSDGRTIWSIPLAEFDAPRAAQFEGFRRTFRDIDGDGGPDVVLTFPVAADTFERRAISLRDGKCLWSRPAEGPSSAVVEDLDGDGRVEVVAIDRRIEGASPYLGLIAFDGRDGSPRWAYRVEDVGPIAKARLRALGLTNLEGKGQREVRVMVDLADGGHRALILDAQGRERAHRDLSGLSPTMTPADLDGDGRDELLFVERDRVFATRGDLRRELWSGPCPAPGSEMAPLILPARAGRSATVLVDSRNGRDGATGRIRWSAPSAQEVLDAGEDGGLPRLLGGSDEETVCRVAMATTPQGTFAPARGEIAPPRPVRGDPRWLRPVPWVFGQANYIPPAMLVAMAGMALINVMLPLAILRLATRRRFWSVRLLVALPVVVAIPMGVFLTIDSLEPVPHDPPWIVGTAMTLAGIPLLVYLWQFGRSLFLGRWIPVATLVLLPILTSIIIGALCLWVDRKRMAPIEHYSWSGWFSLAILGAYTTGILAVIARLARAVIPFIRRLGRGILSMMVFLGTKR